jgi:hypothetical protein
MYKQQKPTPTTATTTTITDTPVTSRPNTSSSPIEHRIYDVGHLIALRILSKFMISSLA